VSLDPTSSGCLRPSRRLHLGAHIDDCRFTKFVQPRVLLQGSWPVDDRANVGLLHANAKARLCGRGRLMRTLRKHFAELWLSYASVLTGVEGTKGFLTPSAKRLSHMGMLFKVASTFCRKGPLVRLILESADLAVSIEGQSGRSNPSTLRRWLTRYGHTPEPRRRSA
jgi:hypothetical protein